MRKITLGGGWHTPAYFLYRKPLETSNCPIRWRNNDMGFRIIKIKQYA